MKRHRGNTGRADSAPGTRRQGPRRPAAPPAFVGLVADDLTGASDSAVHFAVAGWDARVVRHLDDLDTSAPYTSCARLDAVTTNSRASNQEEASQRTANAVDALARVGIDRLFLKIDSAVRGSVAGQVRGAMAAWQLRYPDAVAVVCPAHPEHGRTVKAGTVFVHGLPVAQSQASSDAVTPVTLSALDELIPGSALLPTPKAMNAGAISDTVVLDAESDRDLALVAATIDALGPRAIAVGSGGLARALASRWPAPGVAAAQHAPESATHVLVAVSSPHQAAREQVAWLVDSVQGAILATGSTGRGNMRPDVLVLTTPASPIGGQEPRAIAGGLAEQVSDELLKHSYDAMVLVGGDGALAILDLLEAEQIRIVSDIAPGAPLGVIVGGAARGMRVVTKSGGFGDADALTTIVDRLRRPNGPTLGSVRTERPHQRTPT
jgi:uncharacterized protein YgbK (DUF1537 family)